MGVKTAGVGHFTIPTAPAAGTSVTSGAANTFTTTPIQLIASTAAALYITGVHLEAAAAKAATYIVVQLMIGAGGSETIVGQYLCPLSTASTVALGYRQIYPPIPVASGIRISVKTADSVGAAATLVTLECIAQSNVVDDAIPVTTVTTVTSQLTAAAIATGVWQDATAGDFTAALSIGKSVMNGVALGTGLTINGYTGNTPQTGDSFARIGAAGAGLTALGDTRVANLDAAVTTRMASYTQPTGFLAATFPVTVASTTNITAGTITTVTNLTNAPTAGDLTATMKTSVTTAATAATPTAAAVTGAVGSVTAGVTLGNGAHGGAAATMNLGGAGGLTATHTGSTTGSVGSVTGAVGSVTGNVGGNVTGSVVGAVGSVTGLTAANLDVAVSTRLAVASYTAPDNTTISTINTRIGAAGAGLTAIGDTRMANLDATVSSRSTYAGGAVASVTAAVTVGTNNDKTGYALSSAGVQAIWDALTSALTTVGSIGKRISDYLTGDAYTRIGAAGAGLTALGDTRIANLDATVSTRLAGASYAAPPSAATNATAVRTELATELARVDVATSTRLATAGYTAPDNTGIAAVKAKTDSLGFTAAGKVDSNVTAVNSVAVGGAGTAIDPWSPV